MPPKDSGKGKKSSCHDKPKKTNEQTPINPKPSNLKSNVFP